MSVALRRLAVALALLAAASILSFRSIYEPDLGWHLAQGREDLAGRLVRTNVFSAGFPDYRQHYTSWLFDAGAYGAWSLGGDGAVQALQAGLLAAAFFRRSIAPAASDRRLRQPSPSWFSLSS